MLPEGPKDVYPSLLKFRVNETLIRAVMETLLPLAGRLLHGWPLQRRKQDSRLPFPPVPKKIGVENGLANYVFPVVLKGSIY